MSGEAIGVLWDKGGAVENVRAHGAGPSKSASANATAFQSCLNELNGNGGGTMVIPRGTYQIGSALAYTGDRLFVQSHHATIQFVNDTDGLVFTGEHFGSGGRLRIEGPGAGSSSKVGLKLAAPSTPTALQQVSQGLQVIGFDLGVYLVNVELLKAIGWKVDFNGQNMLMHDGAFNTFDNCRFSSNQHAEHNVLLGGAAGVGNGAGTNHNVFIQCEWLNTQAGQYALAIGQSGFQSSSNVIFKADIERNSTAYGIEVRGINNVLQEPYFHDIQRGIRVVTGSTGCGIMFPRFTTTGFSDYTISNDALPDRVWLVGGNGLNVGGGVIGVAEDTLRVVEETPGADLHDYAIGVDNLLRLDPSTNMQLTGIANGFSGRRIVVVNVNNSNTVTLVHGSASSQQANRLSLPGGSNVVLSQNDALHLWYDATSSRWRPAS